MKAARLLVVMTTVGATLAVLPWPHAAAVAYPVVAQEIRVTTLAEAGAAREFRSKRTFTMVGVSFTGAPQDLQVRFREPGGVWSPWQELHADTEEGPDAASAEGRNARAASTPLWTGPARDLQLRSSLGEELPAEATIHLLDATGRSLSWFEKIAAHLRTGDTAEAVTRPGIYTRRQWLADESLKKCEPDVAWGVKGAFIHHTTGSNDYPAADSAAIVRSIYWYHTQVNGWCDIGYNFLIDRYGLVFEGRSGGVENAVVGAHAGGFNTGSTGIALIGDFSGATPPSPAISSLIPLLAWKFTLHKVDPRGWVAYTSGGNTRYPEGAVVTLPTISGHRDAVATACPARVYDLLPYIRSSVKTDVLHSHGTLLRGSGPAMYRVENERLREMVSPAAVETWGGGEEVISVDDSALLLYRGALRGFRDGSLIKTPDSVTWAISGKLRRRFSSQAVFDALGYAASNVKQVTWQEALIHPEGTPITSSATHPEGAVLRAPDGSVFWIVGGKKMKVVSQGAFDTWFDASEPVAVSDAELATYPDGGLLGHRHGSLLRTPDGGTWIVSNWTKRRFAHPQIFADMGYQWSNVKFIGEQEAAVFPDGPPINFASEPHPSGTLLRGTLPYRFLKAGNSRVLVQSDLVFESWNYRAGELVWTSDAKLASLYTTNPPKGFRDGSLIETPDKKLWIISRGERRPFASWDVFAGLKYAYMNVWPAGWGEVAVHPEGAPVTTTAFHPEGTPLRAPDGTVWWVRDGLRWKFPTDGVYRSWFVEAAVPASSAQIAVYPVSGSGSVGWRDGSVIRLPNSALVTISDFTMRQFMTLQAFDRLGYSWSNVVSANQWDAYLHPLGEPIY